MRSFRRGAVIRATSGKSDEAKLRRTVAPFSNVTTQLMMTAVAKVETEEMVIPGPKRKKGMWRAV